MRSAFIARVIERAQTLVVYALQARRQSPEMPVPYLPVELIKLIVADPTLRKDDLQSLHLTARLFPPLVRPVLFRALELPIHHITEEYEPERVVDRCRAITLAEMERLMAFRLRPDLAALVKKVSIHSDGDSPDLEPPPGSIRMTPHDLMQLVYTVFPRLEEAVSDSADSPIPPPRLSLPCCETLHALDGIALDAHTWIGLQTCTALRELGIHNIWFRGRFPAIPRPFPFRLETLAISVVHEETAGALFLKPFLRACGPTLKRLWLGINFDDVPDLSMLPRLESLGVEMRSDETVKEFGETLDDWLATTLPTCVALQEFAITTPEVGYSLDRTALGLFATPRVAAALPATLKRINFDMLPKEGELEAALSNNKSVQVIGLPSHVR